MPFVPVGEGPAPSDATDTGNEEVFWIEDPPTPLTDVSSVLSGRPPDHVIKRLLGSLGPLGGLLGGGLGASLGSPTGPGAVFSSARGSTAGGMVGKGIENFALDKLGLADTTRTPRDVVMDVIGEGADQGVQDLFGHALSGTMGRMGSVINRYGAVKPSGAILAEFPDVMKTIDENLLPVGRAEKPAGLARLMRKQSSVALDAALNQSVNSGKRWTLEPVKLPTKKQLAKMTPVQKKQAMEKALAPLPPGLRKYLETVSSGKDASARAQKVIAGWNSFVKNAGTPEVGGVPKLGPVGPKGGRPKKIGVDINAKQVKNLKRSYQSESAGVTAPAARKEVYIPPGTKLEGHIDQELGVALKKMLEQEPGIASLEDKTQSLIGASRAIRQAELRGDPRFPNMMGAPGQLANMLLSPLARSDYWSSVARALLNPATRAGVSQVPKAASIANPDLELMQIFRKMIENKTNGSEAFVLPDSSSFNPGDFQ